MPHNVFLLTQATGTIQAGPDQQTRLDELTSRLAAGDFFVPVVQKLASKCIDGRPGAKAIAPNSSGGSETLMVADDLTYKRFAAGSTLEGYSLVLNELQEAGQPIGGHTDDHARDAASGCGANDKLEPIYAFIAEHGEVLRGLAIELGVSVEDVAHDLIVTNAAARTEFSPGSELLTVLETADPKAVDVLNGEHKEVITVVNTVAGTTLNRLALAAEFGPSYQAFNVDAWTFPEVAAFLAKNEAEVPALVLAQTYYNFATAHVLCGPQMRVIVR